MEFCEEDVQETVLLLKKSSDFSLFFFDWKTSQV